MDVCYFVICFIFEKQKHKQHHQNTNDIFRNIETCVLLSRQHLFNMKYFLIVPLTLFVISSYVICESLDELKTRIAAKAKLITDAAGFDMEKLPIIESKMRDSISCPGVQERITLYR